MDDHIRTVEPYVFTYVMHAKQRWFGRTVSDVFHSEYKAHPASYYAAALRDGRIRVNGCHVGVAAHVLKNGDRVEHLAHRHEPPVSVEGLRVVAEDENVVAVFKPSSLPMHPC